MDDQFTEWGSIYKIMVTLYFTVSLLHMLHTCLGNDSKLCIMQLTLNQILILYPNPIVSTCTLIKMILW